VIFLKQDFPAKFDFNPEEISETKWVSLSGLERFLEKSEQDGVPITPWFKGIVGNCLFKQWKILIE
jgi:isopentenyldiphosphate isomerase